MKAKFYLTAILVVFSATTYAQDTETKEKEDNAPPAVTVSDVEQHAKEAKTTNTEYIISKKELNDVGSKEQEKNKEQIAVTNITEKASKKPEKQ
jgi:hypothetical protein